MFGVRARKFNYVGPNIELVLGDQTRSLHGENSFLADVLYLPGDCEGGTGLPTERITRQLRSRWVRTPTFGGHCDDEGLVYLALVARSVDVEDFKLHVSWL